MADEEPLNLSELAQREEVSAEVAAAVTTDLDAAASSSSSAFASRAQSQRKPRRSSRVGEYGVLALTDPGADVASVPCEVVLKHITVTAASANGEIAVLDDVSVAFRPGSMTLVVAGHGGGKSTLLQLAAGRLKPTSGQLLYNSKPLDEANVIPEKIAAFVPQEDDHLSLLTVRETLQFAQESTAVAADPSQAKEETQRKTEAMINMLGLRECADTLVGDEARRGISGGQKKRVTMGEMLMANPRALFLDEVTTGLDSNTSEEIFASLRQWVDKTSGTVVASLLQPTPEVFSFFDNIVLLLDGKLLYQGPADSVLDFVESCGVLCPEDQDVADFLTEFATYPKVLYERQIARTIYKGVEDADARDDIIKQIPAAGALNNGDWENSQRLHEVVTGHIAASNCKLTGDAIREHFDSWDKATEAYSVEPSVSEPFNTSDFATMQYTNPHPHSVMHQIRTCIGRQVKLFGRDKENLIMPRFMQNIILGLIVGGFFRPLDAEQAAQPNIGEAIAILGFLIFLVTNLAFFNMVELPIASFSKSVIHRHLDNQFYSSFAYTLSVAVGHIPLAILDTILYSTVSYWLAGLSSDAADYFAFFIIMLLYNLAMSAMFRSVALFSPSQTVAQIVAPVITATLMLFGGFLITKDKIPDWLIWVYYLSPIRYTHVGLAQIEFYSSEFDDAPLIQGKHAGEYLLEEFEIPTDRAWTWAAPFFSIAWYLVFLAVSALSLKYLRWKKSTGTLRTDDAQGSGCSSVFRGVDSLAIDLEGKENVHGVSLAWQDVFYTVPIGKTEEKTLLNGVSGCATPGKMVALMGASGAGKTTLLDVLARRKTVGKIEGQMFIAGKTLDDESFHKITGYVEQQDAHLPLQSVREAIRFSAVLRLPAKKSEEDIDQAVADIISLLGLNPVADKLIGNAELGGISHGQRKLLSIAIELVANPLILFLDEPTTGLDSRSALTVIGAVEKIANTGRTVICTIHQPSTELFLTFDEAIILQSGGDLVYHGPLGHRGTALESHFEALPAVKPMPQRVNPASWVLELLAVLSGRNTADSDVVDKAKMDKSLDLKESFLQSQSGVESKKLIEAAIALPAEFGDSLTAKRRSSLYSFGAVLNRHFWSLMRNKGYNRGRLALNVVLGLIAGLLYFDLNKDGVSGVQSAASSLTVTCAFLGVAYLQTVAPLLMEMRPSFYRETAVNMYHPAHHAFASAACEIPFVAFFTLVFLAIFYNLVNFDSDAGVFFHTALVYFLLDFGLLNIGLFLVAALPSSQVVQILNGFFQGLFWLFNGIFNPESQISKGFLWFFRFTPYNHAGEALTVLQFRDGDGIVQVSPGVTLTQEEYLGEVYRFNYSARWQETLILLAYIFGFLLLTVFMYTKVRHVQR